MGIPWRQLLDIAVVFCAIFTHWPSASLGLSGDGEKDGMIYANFFEEILPSDGPLSEMARFRLNAKTSSKDDNGVSFHGTLMIMRDGDDPISCSVEVLDMQSGFCRAICAFVDTRKTANLDDARKFANGWNEGRIWPRVAVVEKKDNTTSYIIDAYFQLLPGDKRQSSFLALSAVHRFSYTVSTLLSAINAGDPLYDGQNSAAAHMNFPDSDAFGRFLEALVREQIEATVRVKVAKEDKVAENLALLLSSFDIDYERSASLDRLAGLLVKPVAQVVKAKIFSDAGEKEVKELMVRVAREVEDLLGRGSTSATESARKQLNMAIAAVVDRLIGGRRDEAIQEVVTKISNKMGSEMGSELGSEKRSMIADALKVEQVDPAKVALFDRVFKSTVDKEVHAFLSRVAKESRLDKYKSRVDKNLLKFLSSFGIDVDTSTSIDQLADRLVKPVGQVVQAKLFADAQRGLSGFSMRFSLPMFYSNREKRAEVGLEDWMVETPEFNAWVEMVATDLGGEEDHDDPLTRLAKRPFASMAGDGKVIAQGNMVMAVRFVMQDIVLSGSLGEQTATKLPTMIMSGSKLDVAMSGAGTAKGDGD